MPLDTDAYGGQWTFSNSPGIPEYMDKPDGVTSPEDTWDFKYLENVDNQNTLRGMGYTGDFLSGYYGSGDDSNSYYNTTNPAFKAWAGDNNIVAGKADPNDANNHMFLSSLFNSQTGKPIGTPTRMQNSTTFAQMMAPLLMFAGPALGAAAGGGVTGGAIAGGGIGGVMGGVGALEQDKNILNGIVGGALKGSATGALGNAFGKGIDQYNLGGELGASPAWGNYINKAGNTIGKSLVSGKNPTNALLTSAANPAFNSLSNMFTGADTTTGNNMLDFNTGYDFGSNPTDMQGFPSLTTSGSDYSPSFGNMSDTTQTGSDWQDTLKKLGNNSVIKGLLGLGGPQQPGQPQQQGGGIGNSVLGGLAGLYLGNKQNKAVKGQINNLGSLFGQDSPYAQQLRQQLARKDAAAGRRSQYGNREVELQARLAELNSRNAPQLQSLYNQQSGNRNLMVNTLLNNKGLQGLFKQGVAGLNNYLQPSPDYSYVDGGNEYDAYDFGG